MIVLSNKRKIALVSIVSVSTLLLGGAYGGHLIAANKGLQVLHDPVVTRDLERAAGLRKRRQWDESYQLLSSHAAGNHPRVKYWLAYQLSRGWGVARDLETALDLQLQAVKFNFPGRADAAYELGKLYRISRGEDCQILAFEWFIKSLAWGNKKSHLEIAKAYARGLGTNVNFDKAVEHYTAAAQDGSAAAVFSWIALVENGVAGVAANPEGAALIIAQYLPIIETKAEAGDVYSARALARLYKKGGVLTKDHMRSKYWFEKAVESGDPSSMHDLAMMTINEDYDWYEDKMVVGLLKSSAQAGYAGAMTAMGRLHLSERYGLAKEGAKDWFSQGVEAGHAGSMEELARLHFEGTIKGADIKKALSLAQQGARLRHKGSKSLLDEIRKSQKILVTASRSSNVGEE